MKAIGILMAAMVSSAPMRAHDWHRDEDLSSAMVQLLPEAEIAVIAAETFSATALASASNPAHLLEAAFAAFAPKVKTRFDTRWFHVESDGLPAHDMMVGITAWQQQVPLPQRYAGANTWRIPLHPVVSQNPASIRGRFLRGAIALAANGIPIFNPQNNRGEISAKIGELDQWGGHCGRADDYHYHAAPLHLQTVLGKSLPIAFALDGFPIYGLAEPDGSAPVELDAFHGHETPRLGYHYHASTQYPYVNGGFHGEVTEVGGQVDPQPRAQPVRPDLPPLRGAKIVGFTNSPDLKTFALRYTVHGAAASVNYAAADDGAWRFQFKDADGRTREETYRAGERRGRGGAPPRDKPPRQGQAYLNEPALEFGAQNQTPPRQLPSRGDQISRRSGEDSKGLIKPAMSDTLKVTVYADNWFVMFINGKLRAVDPIEFTPHNVVSVDILPEYPMTLAIMAKDNADPKTGLEYGDHIGDGGFILKFADGTVSNAKWKAKNFFKGPLNGDVKKPRVEHTPIPTNWFAVNFDDSEWSNAVEFTEGRVNPKEPFYNADFKGAKFIWTSDLDLDNTVIFRTRVEKPGWKPRWNTRPDLDASGAPTR